MTTWLERESAPSHPAGQRLRVLLAGDALVQAPGAHNAMAGLIARDAGFQCLYVSGAAITASMGLPDLGVLTMEELAHTVRSIARATRLPIIVDGDTGYGEALNAMRLVVELESAGAAAVHIEDQVLPKKCGHLNDKTLVPVEHMAAKVAAAKRAARDMVIIARTDAAASEGLGGAISRARRYVEAGADVVFPDALTTKDEFRRFVDAVDAPVMVNMTEFGRTPLLSAQELEALGARIVIWPVSSLRIAAAAMEAFYRRLAIDGSNAPQTGAMQTRARLYELIGYSAFEVLDASLVASLLPKMPDEG